jgi:hypothetical protein
LLLCVWDAAQLMPRFLDRHEVPHVPLVAPRAQIKIFLGHLGTFCRPCRRRSWALLHGCLYGLVNDVADCLGEPVGGVAHRCCLGSSVR